MTQHPPDRIPWVKFECGAALGELLRVSPAAELAHRRLSEYHWHTGEWPSTAGRDAAALCRVSRPRWTGLVAELALLGWREQRGRICHSAVHRVRAEALAALRSVRKRGRLGAKRRWAEAEAPADPPGPGGPPHGSAIAKPIAEPMAEPAAASMAEPMQSNSKTDSKSTDKSTANAVNGERLTRTVSPHEEEWARESEFLEEVLQVLKLWSPAFASGEMENWGGWWRNRFRERPAKARRVIAELKSMIRERRILKDPGRAATDLWERLP